MATTRTRYKAAPLPPPDRALAEEIEAILEVHQWTVVKARAVYDQLRPFFEKDYYEKQRRGGATHG